MANFSAKSCYCTCHAAAYTSAHVRNNMGTVLLAVSIVIVPQICVLST